MVVLWTRSLKISNVNFLIKEQVNRLFKNWIAASNKTIKRNKKYLYYINNIYHHRVRATKPVCHFYIQKIPIHCHTRQQRAKDSSKTLPAPLLRGTILLLALKYIKYLTTFPKTKSKLTTSNTVPQMTT